MDGHTKYAQTYAHSETNRYEQGAACEARRESANTGEGCGSAESAKKPAPYIHCDTVCSMYVYYISSPDGRIRWAHEGAYLCSHQKANRYELRSGLRSKTLRVRIPVKVAGVQST